MFRSSWLLSAAISILLASACRPSRPTIDSSASTVDTANTSIKNQGEVGFCWAYAAVAMIESNYKKRTGREIDLNEDAIAFFKFAEQLKYVMDYNLQNNKAFFLFDEGGQINFKLDPREVLSNPNVREEDRVRTAATKDAFSLIERWGLIPQSQWNEKFETIVKTKNANERIKIAFFKLLGELQGKQSSVQMNQIFSLLKESVFSSVPPVDGFNTDSGRMNSVQYARDAIGFRKSGYEDVYFEKAHPNLALALASTLQRVKRSLAAGDVVGISISMPNGADWLKRIQFTRFIGLNQSFNLGGSHAMVITDFKHPGGTYGPVPNVDVEVEKPLDVGLQFRLKNSWGSQNNLNEFGQTIRSGYYDMDFLYITDVLKSNGFVIFTFAPN